MKSHGKTTRHYHLRRVKSGIVPIRQHLMLYWKTMFPDKPVGYKPSPAIIRQNMFRLLYHPQKDAKRTEMLTIIVPKQKEEHYKFLEAYTKFPARGKWKQFDEANSVLEVQYQDTPDDRIGKSLITLVGLYNRSVVGEQVPYAYTKHVDESTLMQDLDKDGVKDYDDCEPLDPKKQDAPLYAMLRHRDKDVAVGTGTGESIGTTIPAPTKTQPSIVPKISDIREFAGDIAKGARKVAEVVGGKEGKIKAEAKDIAKGLAEEQEEIKGRAKALQDTDLERKQVSLQKLEARVREKELQKQLKEMQKKPEPVGDIGMPRPRGERKSRAQRKLEKLQVRLETERIKAELKELKEAKKKPKRVRQVQAPVVQEGVSPEAVPVVRKKRKRRKKKFVGIFGVKI